MAASNKKVKQAFIPKVSKQVVRIADPTKFYNEKPAWSFSRVDPEMWTLDADSISEIFDKLKNYETQKWSEIFVKDNKSNHSNQIKNMNKVARDRLDDLHIEAEALQSIRLTGNHRLYGFMEDRVFVILWYDKNHGDNSDCVYRSKIKNT